MTSTLAAFSPAAMADAHFVRAYNPPRPQSAVKTPNLRSISPPDLHPHNVPGAGTMAETDGTARAAWLASQNRSPLDSGRNSQQTFYTSNEVVPVPDRSPPPPPVDQPWGRNFVFPRAPSRDTLTVRRPGSGASSETSSSPPNGHGQRRNSPPSVGLAESRSEGSCPSENDMVDQIKSAHPIFPSSSYATYSNMNGLNPLSPHVEPFNPNAVGGPSSKSSYAGLSPAAPFVNITVSDKRNLVSLASDDAFSNFELSAPSEMDIPQVHQLYGESSREYVNTAEVTGQPSPFGTVSPHLVAPSAFSSALNRERPTDSVGVPYVAASSAPSSSQSSEEISTIFVVGFPDDMQEREFQNMFVFSPGFEAATLKIPPSITNGPSATLNGVGMRGPEFHHVHDGSSGEEGYGGYDGQQAHHPSLPSNALGTVSTRKQIIGFAKFRTRAEALDARDVLSGRRVDAEKGSVLKAEMAKKNLHTKRGLANDAPVGSALTSSVGNPSGNASNLAQSHPHALAAAAAAATLNPTILAGMLAANPSSSQSTGSVAAILREQQERDREVRAQLQQSAAYDAFHSVPLGHQERTRSPPVSDAEVQPLPSIPTASSSARNVPGGLVYGKSLMQQLDDESDELPPLPGYQGDSGMHAFFSAAAAEDASGREGRDSRAGYSRSQQNQSVSRMSGLSLNTNAVVAGSTSLPSPTTGSLAGVSPSFPRTQNPADQNPPINTLYVGGLPAVLPSLTGPMSAAHLEDGLRAAFSRCPGFKRLCFRQKSNGPMCFVEFEDVAYATRALNEMYGNSLGGIVKGGIRLSFSKNPLGVRTGSVSGGTGSVNGTSSPGLLGSTSPYSSAVDVGFSLASAPLPSSSATTRRPSDAFYSLGPASSAPVQAHSMSSRSFTPRSATTMSPPPSMPSSMSAFTPFAAFSTGAIGDAH